MKLVNVVANVMFIGGMLVLIFHSPVIGFSSISMLLGHDWLRNSESIMKGVNEE